MSQRDGQVDDDVDVIARQQVLDAIGLHAIFGGESLRALGQDIGAGDKIDRLKRRAAANICRRDDAGADDAHIKPVH